MPGRTDLDLPLLDAIADDVRLAILRRLAASGPATAGDLRGCCDVGQSTVSHHLKVLRDAGWVESERRGSWMWYSLRAAAADQLRRIADGVRPDGTRVEAAPPAADPSPAGTDPPTPSVAVPERRRTSGTADGWRQW